VGAAANLTDVFTEVGRAFKAKTGVEVVFSYGSTAQLAQQIENGAPFDVFAAADTDHVDSLVSKGKLVSDSRAVYAIGQLALWIPKGEQSGVRELKDLARQSVRFIAIAQPELAPYGQAAVDSLKAAGLWDVLQPKVVFANNISQAKQFAISGNADAAFTAYSLAPVDGMLSAMKFCMWAALVGSVLSAQSKSVLIEDLTWTEVRDAIAAGTTTAIYYAGSIEQNGPGMALGKHLFIAHYAAQRIAEELGNALVYPTMPFAPTGDPQQKTGHMRFAGSVNISEQAYGLMPMMSQ